MHVPEPGPQVPQRGNYATRFIGRLLLKLCRWRTEGELHNSSKFVIVLAPHTSWWDFTMNLGVLLAIGIRSNWFIANKYTWWPVGSLLGVIGAIPVERSSSQDLVTQMVNQFRNNEQFVLAIFPEGTRKKVEKWKTGFWHIAVQSEVPIQLVSVDYGERVTTFGPTMKLSGNIESDMKQIQNNFKNVRPKYPEKFGGEYL